MEREIKDFTLDDLAVKRRQVWHDFTCDATKWSDFCTVNHAYIVSWRETLKVPFLEFRDRFAAFEFLNARPPSLDETLDFMQRWRNTQLPPDDDISLAALKHMRDIRKGKN